MSDHVPFTIIERDEVDLLALLRTLREAEVRAREICYDLRSEPEAQREINRTTDKRAADTLGGIAGRDCARFEGERSVTSNYREAKERAYSLYAMHPDTAEQVIKAVEFLIERFGPRFEAHTRPTRIAPKTVRNSDGQRPASAPSKSAE